MSDTDETKRPGKTLSLKKTETSTVKQSFSHGRTKAVVVEKKRSAAPPAAPPSPPASRRKNRRARAPGSRQGRRAPRRPRLLAAAWCCASFRTRKRPAAPRPWPMPGSPTARRAASAEQDAERKAREEEQLRTERVAAEKRKAEEDARKAADELARKRAEAGSRAPA